MAQQQSRWRLNVTQLLLLAALVGLLVGAGSSAWRTAQLERPVGVVASPGGTRLATWSEDGQFLVWDISGLRPRRVFEDRQHEPVYSAAPLAFLDDNLLAIHKQHERAGLIVGRVELIDVRQGQVLAGIDLGPNVDQVAFAPSAQLMAVSHFGSPAISLTDLKTRQVLRTIPLNAIAQSTALTGNGSLLVTQDAQSLRVELRDAASGELLRTIENIQVASALHPSSQGKWLALFQAADSLSSAPFQESPWTIAIHELPAGREVASFPCEIGYATGLVFSPDDSKLLCVYEGASSQLVALPSGRKIVSLDDEQLTGKAYAFLPDGRRVAGVSWQQLALWDTATGRRVQTIWQARPTLQMFLFGAGLAVWGLVWGRLARAWNPPRRSVLETSVTEAAVVEPATTPADSNEPFAPASSPRQAPRATPMWRSLLILLALMLLPAYFITANWALTWGQRILLVWVIAAALVAVILAGVVVFAVLRSLLSRGYAAQLGRAVQLSGRQGRTRQAGRFTAWFVGRSRLEPVLPNEIARAERMLNELLGPFDYRRPGLIVGLDDHGLFERYVGRRLPLAGVYYGWRPKQLVLCERHAEEGLSEPWRVWRSLLAYHLLLERKQCWLPPWVQLVLNCYLMDGADDSHLLRATHRRLQLHARRGAFKPEELLGLSRKQLTRQVLQQNEAQAGRRTTELYDVARSLCAWLLGTEAGPRREQFARFVNRWSKRAATEQLLRDEFGRDARELLAEWQEWMLRQPTDTSERPTWWLARQLVERTVPLIRDERADGRQRARAIRGLGATGYGEAAGVLVEIARQADSPLRDDAAWAVECLTGQPLGDNVAELVERSERWLESLRIVPAEFAADDASDTDVARGATAEVSPSLNASPPRIAGDRFPAATDEPPSSDLPAPPLPAAIAPSGLRQVWALMGMGGVAALTFGMLMLFDARMWWLPTPYFGLLVGTLGIAQAAGQLTRRLPLLATLQILCLANCDVVNFALGVFGLILLRGKAVRQYLGR
ncbi:MAG: WD40 repeat domain-containing protein [Pirellulaceae bacterium]|nr:WD40 repeat domain-containing protein [Pirellulaceae bacterium]